MLLVSAIGLWQIKPYNHRTFGGFGPGTHHFDHPAVCPTTSRGHLRRNITAGGDGLHVAEKLLLQKYDIDAASEFLNSN